MTPSVIVHGGAGDLAPERIDAHVRGCEVAIEAALEVLRGGGTAVDAAQRAVEVLEDDPRYNAGRGACLTDAGTVELDASIMDGETLRYGAVAVLPPFRHPIAVARAVMDDGRHVLYAAEGARRFALAHGFTAVDADALVTAHARARWEEVRRGLADPGYPGGTVGAVAFDGVHVAAATSTGGIMNKASGRVGDSPIAGAGTYAEDLAGGASATGQGEAILRVCLTHGLVASMRAGASAHDAAAESIEHLAARTGATGGVVALDRAGQPGHARNTRTMAWAWGALSGARRSGW